MTKGDPSALTCLDCLTVALINVAGEQKIVKHPSADNKNTHWYRLLRTVTHFPESKGDTGLLCPHARRRPSQLHS